LSPLCPWPRKSQIFWQYIWRLYLNLIDIRWWPSLILYKYHSWFLYAWMINCVIIPHLSPHISRCIYFSLRLSHLRIFPPNHKFRRCLPCIPTWLPFHRGGCLIIFIFRALSVRAAHIYNLVCRVSIYPRESFISVDTCPGHDNFLFFQELLGRGIWGVGVIWVGEEDTWSYGISWGGILTLGSC